MTSKRKPDDWVDKAVRQLNLNMCGSLDLWGDDPRVVARALRAAYRRGARAEQKLRNRLLEAEIAARIIHIEKQIAGKGGKR